MLAAIWPRLVKIAEELATLRDGCYKIRDVARMYTDMLHKLRPLLSSLTQEMVWGIEQYGTDYRRYPEDVKQTVAAGMGDFPSDYTDCPDGHNY